MRSSLGLQTGPGADYSCFGGAGAFLSTPSDLVRLGSAMLRPGLLTAETIRLFQTPLLLKSGASTGFALGWKVDVYDQQLNPANGRVFTEASDAQWYQVMTSRPDSLVCWFGFASSFRPVISTATRISH